MGVCRPILDLDERRCAATITAGVFEAIVHDLRAVLRLAKGRKE